MKSNSQKPKSKKQKENKSVFLNFIAEKPYVIILIFIVAVYTQVINFGHTSFDDDFLIVNNMEKLRNTSNLSDIFTGNSFLTNAVSGFYRPLQTVSFMFDAYLGNGSLVMFHITNFLLHCIFACLLIVLFRKLKLDKLLSFSVVLVFSIHPLFTADVGWLPSRGDLLITVFCILSFILFIKYNESHKIYLSFLHAVLMLFAFFSKETAILFPVIIIAYMLYNKNSLFKKDIIPVYFLWAVIYAVWYFLRSGAIQDLPDKQIFGLVPFIENLRSLPEYISKFAIPYNLMPLPVYQTAVTIIGGLIIIFIIAFFFYKKDFNKRTFVFGVVWFIILILPGMFYSRYYPKSEMFYHYLDHRAYLPAIGFLIVIISMFESASRKINPKNLVVSVIILSVILSIVSFNRVKIYNSPENFLNAALEANPNASVAYFLRGNYYKDKNEINKAIEDYSSAIKIDAQYAEALNNRGSLFGVSGQYAQSINDLNQAIKYDPKIPDGYFNRAIARDALRDYQGAVNDFKKAIELTPNDYLIYFLRANSLSSLKQYEKALNDYNVSINLHSGFPDAYVNRGLMKYNLSDSRGACRDWNIAAEMGSNSAMKMIDKYCK